LGDRDARRARQRDSVIATARHDLVVGTTVRVTGIRGRHLVVAAA
jgi:membrane protein implicated in regulation of membrane protease activity